MGEDGRRICPVCGRELIWEVCDHCRGRGQVDIPVHRMGQPTGTIEHLCYCCGAQGGWWTCTGVEIEPAHQAEIRRQRRRAHLQALLVGVEP